METFAAIYLLVPFSMFVRLSQAHALTTGESFLYTRDMVITVFKVNAMACRERYSHDIVVNT